MKTSVKDLAGPGIGNYADLEKELPDDYTSVLSLRETQEAIFAIKDYIEDALMKELNLIRVTVPLIVDKRSGINDLLDRDGARKPVGFHIVNDYNEHSIDAEVVQAATKWKRLALRQFDMKSGEGILTDMRAVRKDYFLDHDHSVYVDQWDWESVIEAGDRNLTYLTSVVNKIWKVIKGAEHQAHRLFPQLEASGYPKLPEKLYFIHAEELYNRYPDLYRKDRETELLKEHPAVFIYGIGYPLKNGYPHEMRAADYDDWITETIEHEDGTKMHGLNGDILVWNPVTKRRHELTSMGVRVNAKSLRAQLKMSRQQDLMDLPYHKSILNGQLPLSIGGGIGQSRVNMLLLQKAHLGEVSVSVWPEVLRAMCNERNIHVLK